VFSQRGRDAEKSISLGPQPLQRCSENTSHRLRLAGLRVRLLRDPSNQRHIDIRVETQANLRPDPRPRPTALVFFAFSYCARPRLMVPTTYYRTAARRLPCPGYDHHTPLSRRRARTAAQLTAGLREGLGAAKPRLDVGRVRAVTVRAPRRPACGGPHQSTTLVGTLDSVRCSRSLGDRSAARGPIEVLLRWEPVLGWLG
jgi:hypothetical protein